MTTELLNQLLEKAKANPNTLLSLKLTAVKAQEFELAAQLRQYELDHYPEPLESKQAKIKGQELNLLLRMVGLEVPNDVAWLIYQTIKKHGKRKGNLSLKDAAELMAKRKEWFRSEV